MYSFWSSRGERGAYRKLEGRRTRASRRGGRKSATFERPAASLPFFSLKGQIPLSSSFSEPPSSLFLLFSSPLFSSSCAILTVDKTFTSPPPIVSLFEPSTSPPPSLFFQPSLPSSLSLPFTSLLFELLWNPLHRTVLSALSPPTPQRSWSRSFARSIHHLSPLPPPCLSLSPSLLPSSLPFLARAPHHSVYTANPRGSL